ncbi:hypothetical protein [uncultured Pontibacter sp.]|uniref:hypothetical protein n=1 Tax=uncultured Pontibacter sp. TaxID=453356 RepID=UPI00260A618A|nr:hypothetical protein [uncultured Pontibacter sp.]
MRRKILYILFITLFAYSCGKTEGGAGGGSHPLQQQALTTAYTVRIPGSSPEEQAILLTQTVYPATREDNAVGAIILCPQDAAIAFTAMSRITHMPVNAPLLYLNKDGRLSEQTLREMKRLSPDGVFQDQRTDVYAVNVPEAEVQKVREVLGYRVRTFNEPDPVKLAELLDRWQAALKSDHPDEVIITALDHPKGMQHGLGPMGWNAHMGKGFAWVYTDSIPTATREILKKRYGDHGSFMYLTGGPDVISDKVARELAQYGLVRRIFGPTPPATSAVNAGYKDYGRNHGWWWAWEERMFGWGIAQAGHNFIVGRPDNLLGMIPAAVLGHMGKHGPMLLIEPDNIPNEVREYLTMVKPFATGPQETILNFAWIIGDTTQVSVKAQQTVDRLLSPYQVPVDTAAYLPKADTLQEKKE